MQANKFCVPSAAIPLVRSVSLPRGFAWSSAPPPTFAARSTWMYPKTSAFSSSNQPFECSHFAVPEFIQTRRNYCLRKSQTNILRYTPANAAATAGWAPERVASAPSATSSPRPRATCWRSARPADGPPSCRALTRASSSCPPPAPLLWPLGCEWDRRSQRRPAAPWPAPPADMWPFRRAAWAPPPSDTARRWSLAGSCSAYSECARSRNIMKRNDERFSVDVSVDCKAKKTCRFILCITTTLTVTPFVSSTTTTTDVGSEAGSVV